MARFSTAHYEMDTPNPVFGSVGRHGDAGRLEQPGDDVGRLAIAGFEEVSVHIERRRSVGVAKASADGAHRHARRQQLGGVQMPEVMKSNTLQVDLVAESSETAGDRVGMQRMRAVYFGGEHECRAR